MLSSIKRRLYFVVAAYFGFWARFVLRRWQPKVVVVTGSTGKTTTLHMIEAQLGDSAVYTHHANSALGLPFFLLGLPPNVVSKGGAVGFVFAWLVYVVRAPFLIGRHLPTQQLLVAEADTDRPGEGAFLAKLLKPDFTIWVSVYRTHSMNFDRLIQSGEFDNHEDAISYEFGYFAAHTKDMVVANGDQPHLVRQLERVPEGTKTVLATLADVKNYQIDGDQTIFRIDGKDIYLQGLHPKEVGTSLQMVNSLLEYLDTPLDSHYTKLNMPPGRSSVFKGKKDTILVDSTYNTGLGAMTALLHLFDEYPAKHKWVVLGDILEQGSLEADEHKGLAEVINSLDVERVILLGPRTKKDTLPLITVAPVESFESPKDVLDYLQKNLKGGEAILFKGGRFLEGVIEQLLADPSQAKDLVRREASWVKRRQHWGLPR